MRFWRFCVAALAFFVLPVCHGVAEAVSLYDDGDVVVSFEGDDDVLSLSRDFMASLSVAAPEGVEVSLPTDEALRERFQGFALAEGYDLEPERGADGLVRFSKRWRLVADPSAERFRLAPFAISIVRGGDECSVASRPYLFPVSSLPAGDGDVEVAPEKFFLFPTAKTLLRWSLWLLAAVCAGALIFFLVKRLHRAVRLRMMSPSERAFAELASLLSKQLAERGLFKDYYVELTHVVRRYIERSYKIRAPRLTTEEFMELARGDGRFSDEALGYLREFLYSADLVKFAQGAASMGVAGEAAQSARSFIERDCQLAEQATKEGR